MQCAVPLRMSLARVVGELVHGSVTVADDPLNAVHVKFALIHQLTA